MNDPDLEARLRLLTVLAAVNVVLSVLLLILLLAVV